MVRGLGFQLSSYLYYASSLLGSNRDYGVIIIMLPKILASLVTGLAVLANDMPNPPHLGQGIASYTQALVYKSKVRGPRVEAMAGQANMWN